MPCQLFSCNALKLTSLGSTLPQAGLESSVESNHAQKEDGSNNGNDPNNDIPACPASSNNVCKTGHGVDRSFPIHHAQIAGTVDDDNNVDDTTNGDKNPYGSLWDAKERQEFYNAYMDKCRDRMGVWGYLCDESEAARIESNLIQPSSMKVRIENWISRNIIFSILVDYAFVGSLFYENGYQFFIISLNYYC